MDVEPQFLAKGTPMQFKRALAGVVVGAMLATAACAASQKSEHGKAELRSAGPLAFGPHGVLFIGDPKGAAIFAVETNETASPSSGRSKPLVNVDGINQKVASLLG